MKRGISRGLADDSRSWRDQMGPYRSVGAYFTSLGFLLSWVWVYLMSRLVTALLAGRSKLAP